LESAAAEHHLPADPDCLLPHITFFGRHLEFASGEENPFFMALPGHSADNLGVLVEERSSLVCRGCLYGLSPILSMGNIDDMIASLKKIGKMGLENVVQGHGDIVLAR